MTRKSPRRKNNKRLTPRRGMAVLLILGLLAMTLALSYATLRGQATAAQQTDNLGRGDEARLAAESGMQAALRKISESNWGGVDSTLAASVSNTASYSVAFQTGDALLSASDPLYSEYPFRLTITSTGTALDPARPAVQATYKICAVAQLARRKLNPLPSGWSSLESPAVYQWANREVYAQLPLRIQGPATLKGAIHLCPDYPATSTSRQRYLQDLNAMRLAGQADQRPFNGPLTLVYARQDSATMTALQTDLGIATVASNSTSTAAPVSAPNSLSSYRLYPGGKAYSPPVLQSLHGSTLLNVTLAPHPVTNPLGVFRSTGDLTICNNVNLTGTILAEGSTDIQICGSHVTLAAPNLPALEGSNQSWQLPTLIVRDDMRIVSDSSVGIQGQTLVFDEFEIQSGSQSTQFFLDGQLLTAAFAVRGRSSWSTSSVIWSSRYFQFQSQLSPPDASTIPWFPAFMQAKSGYNVQPTLTIQRNSSGVKYHWQDWSQAVFQKDPADSGLRWNLVRWMEDV